VTARFGARLLIALFVWAAFVALAYAVGLG